MEWVLFLVVVPIAAIVLMRRSRATGSDSDEYVHGAEDSMPEDNLAERRAGNWDGPGGPIAGGRGGSAAGSG